MKQTIEGLQVANKTVFVRVDFNVPMKDGVITDDTRIRSALPTINYLIEKGAKVILASHFGRPKGERKLEMSLAPCAKHLSDLINKPVAFVDDCIGPKVEEAVKALQSGDVLKICVTTMKKLKMTLSLLSNWHLLQMLLSMMRLAYLTVMRHL